MVEADPEARALRESEQRFRTLAEAAREAILINENGIIREVNTALTQMLGYSRDELLGKNGVDLLLARSRGLQFRRAFVLRVAAARPKSC